MTKETLSKSRRPKRAAYQTPLSIVPAKIWQYDSRLSPGSKNDAPPPDRRQKAQARRAAHEAGQIGQRERDAAQRALKRGTGGFEVIGRLGQAGVDYSRLLALVEAAGSLAWLTRMHLDQIHALACDPLLAGWDLFVQVRPFILSMEQVVEWERRRLEDLANVNSIHRPIKYNDHDFGEAEGW